MVSTRAKGRIYELLCKKKLEESGWLVHLVDMPQRFKKHQDLFDTFDIFAVRKREKLFIQVKHDDAWKANTIRKLAEFRDRWLSNDDMVQLWNWQPKQKDMRVCNSQVSTRNKHISCTPGWEIISV